MILLRHGQSQWNLENKFTGWTDVDLTEKGAHEACEAGSQIKKNRLNVNIVYTSLLKRAINTAKITLNQLPGRKIDVRRDWRLNERHYGALQGLNKADTAKKYGDEQVLAWRRSYDISPPKMDANDDRHPSKDPLYEKIDATLLPSSESLKDTIQRVKPLLEQGISPLLEEVSFI